MISKINRTPIHGNKSFWSRNTKLTHRKTACRIKSNESMNCLIAVSIALMLFFVTGTGILYWNSCIDESSSCIFVGESLTNRQYNTPAMMGTTTAMKTGTVWSGVCWEFQWMIISPWWTNIVRMLRIALNPNSVKENFFNEIIRSPSLFLLYLLVRSKQIKNQ